MYICPNCKRTSEAPMNFCVGCGTPMVEQAPAVAQPQYQQVPVQQPQYEQPQYQQAPVQQPQYEQPQYQQAPVQQPQYEQPQYQQAPVQQPQYEQPQYQQAPVQQPQYAQPQFQQAPVQQQYTQPQYQQQYAPVTNQTVNAGPSKAKVIIGMVLSIVGLAMAFICFVSYFSNLDYNGGAYAFGYAFGFSIFSFPAALVGLIFSKNNRNEGDISAMSMIGKILGLVGVILSGVTLFIGLCCIGL